MTRVAVIGAGPCGLAQLHAFASDQQAGGGSTPEVVCYEKQSDWGRAAGTTAGAPDWTSTASPATPACTATCGPTAPRSAWSSPTTASRSTSASPSPRSRPARSSTTTSWAGPSAAASATGSAFNHTVRRVGRSADGSGFTVTAHDLANDADTAEDYDYVVVSTGHFSIPNMPHYPGYETFGGTLMHAHDFRDAVQFRRPRRGGDRVELLGRGHRLAASGSTGPARCCALLAAVPWASTGPTASPRSRS